MKTRGVDPDAHLDRKQHATALLVQRTLEDHYAFVLAYTHLVSDEGMRHTDERFASLPAIARPLVARLLRRAVKGVLWKQGILRLTPEEIVEAAMRDWQAVLAFRSDGPFFFGDKLERNGRNRLWRAGDNRADADRDADTRPSSGRSRTASPMPNA